MSTTPTELWKMKPGDVADIGIDGFGSHPATILEMVRFACTSDGTL